MERSLIPSQHFEHVYSFSMCSELSWFVLMVCFHRNLIKCNCDHCLHFVNTLLSFMRHSTMMKTRASITLGTGEVFLGHSLMESA